MDQHKPIHAPIPGLGLRSIKTALAVTLTALFYALLPDRNPTFACIGAIFGLGSDMEDSWRSGGNRLFGTVIGGFIGMWLYWIEHKIVPTGNYYLCLPFLFFGILILVSFSVLFRWPGAVQPGGVVLCIILYNTPPNHISYALDRMLDTGIGVVVAFLINLFFPRSRLERWLHLGRNQKKDTSF